MAHTRRTIELNERWDISLNETGKIPVREGAIATAQDVANECRRFTMDTYFSYDVGIPHFDIELGHILPDALLRRTLRLATLRVDDVASILGIEIEDFNRETRTLTGNITFTVQDGEILSLSL